MAPFLGYARGLVVKAQKAKGRVGSDERRQSMAGRRTQGEGFRMIRFNVYGKHVVGVERRDDEWKTYLLGDEGKRRDAEFLIPADIPENELGHYLAVLFHESATPERNEVKQLG